MIGAGRLWAQRKRICPAVAFETRTQLAQSACVLSTPAHARVFDTRLNDMFAGRLNGAAAYLQALAALDLVIHVYLVGSEVGHCVQCSALWQSRVPEFIANLQVLVEACSVELWIGPLLTCTFICWIKRLSDFLNVATRMRAVKKLDSLWKEFLCCLPQPACTISDQDFALGLLQPTAIRFQPEQLREGRARTKLSPHKNVLGCAAEFVVESSLYQRGLCDDALWLNAREPLCRQHPRIVHASRSHVSAP